MLVKIAIILAFVRIASTNVELKQPGTTDDWGESFGSTTAVEIPKQNASAILEYDNNNEQSIYGFTDSLLRILSQSKEIVIAAYKVANYVPNLHNSQHAAFWKHQVIPNLVESLNQDVKARNVIIRSLSSITDLSITIQKSAEIVIQSKGSRRAKEIAKRNIPAALSDLTTKINEASGVDNLPIKRFSEQTTQLFHIIGPEAANFIKMKAEYLRQIDEQEQKQEEVFKKLAVKQGEAAKLNMMIYSIEKRNEATQKEIQESNDRIDELNNINKNLDKTIENIPGNIQRKIVQRSSSGWWLWKRSVEREFNIQMRNPYRDIDADYYNRLILSRMSRIKSVENEKDAKQKIKEAFDKDLSDLKGRYNTTLGELEYERKALNETLSRTQTQIDFINARINDIDKSEINITGMTGLSGQTLIQCLISVREFAKSLGKGTTLYSQLSSILSAIKKIVNVDVELLESDEHADVLLSVNRLLQQVKFLSSYTLRASAVLKASTEYNLQGPSEENLIR